MSAEKLETQIRQDQIAQAALNVISSYGLKALSLARVARQVGLVPSAIYRHFDSKDAVIDAVLGLIGDRLRDNVEAACRETSDPLEQLRRLLMRHIRLIRENQGIPRLVFSEDVYAGRPERKAQVRGIIVRYLRKVAELIRAGQKRGQLRSDHDAAVLAVMFLGLVQPAAILWHISDGTFDVTKQAERAWRVFSQAIQSNGKYRATR